MQNIYTLGSDKWRRWISTNIANNSVNIESAQSTANQLAFDLNTEVENRISSDENIQNQIDVIESGQLGSIKPTDAAPTPARNGNYTFSTGGAKPAWLTAEPLVTEVKAGDGVAVVYTAPSTYSYTHIDIKFEFDQSLYQGVTSKLKGSEINIINGYYLATSNGLPVQSANSKHTDYLLVESGGYITIISDPLGSGISRSLVFYDALYNEILPLRLNGEVCSMFRTEGNDGSSLINGTFPVPSGAVYVRFIIQYSTIVSLDSLFITCLSNKLKPSLIPAVTDALMSSSASVKLNKYSNATELVQKTINGVDLNIINGYYLAAATGLLTESADSKYTDYIKVFGSTITISSDTLGAGVLRGLSFYDAFYNQILPLRPNGVVCSMFRTEGNDGSSLINGTFPVPSGAVYVRFTVQFSAAIVLANINVTLFVEKFKVSELSESEVKMECLKGSEIPSIKNYYISSTTGLRVMNVGSISTDYLPIRNQSTYSIYSNRFGAGVRGFSFYDANHNPIKPLRPDGSTCTNYALQDNNLGVLYQCQQYPVPVGAFYYAFTIQYTDAVDINSVVATCMTDKLSEKQQRRTGNQFLGLERIIRYSYSLNTANYSTSSNVVTSAQDSEAFATDYAVLMLPLTYDPNGLPTRLVIGCHGGGGGVEASTSQTEGYAIYKYLVANGYAVMDCGGMPQAYSIANSIDWYRVMGCLFAVNSYEKAYSYYVSNYNLARDGVMLVGMSNGGLTSNNIYAHSNIPIRAMAGLSALISMDTAWNIATGAMSGGLYSQYQNRANIIKIYGMTPVSTQEELNNAVIEPDKIIGFDPINYDTYMNGTAVCKRHRIPYKLWHPVDDPAVPIESVREFVQRLKNGNSLVSLREMASGGHAPDTAGSVIGTFRYYSGDYSLYPAAAELLMWFNRFN